MTTLLIIGGLALLILGGEILIKSSTNLASRLGMKPIVIGLTIIAMGTSAPEIIINLSSISEGHSSLALGNILGSNIFNILFILGISALITPLIINQKLIKIDIPILIILTITVWIFSLDLNLSFNEGIILFILLILFIIFSIKFSKKESPEVIKEYENEFSTPRKSLLLTIIYFCMGLTLLLLGSHYLVNGSVSLARSWGISELIIGITILACGSGTPEVVISVMAARKKEYDIAIGNIIGSCIFNILFVLGTSIIIFPNQPIPPEALNFDIPIMILTSIICLPICLSDQKVSRIEGLLLLLYFVSYISFIILNSSGHDAIEPFGKIVGLFFIPITMITLFIISLKELRKT